MLKSRFRKVIPSTRKHRPHITLLQRFVRTADLDKVYAAADKTLAAEKITGWKLTAIKYYFVAAPPIGLAGIVIAPSDDLLRLQQELVDAVAPYTVETGTAEAFFTRPGEPGINPGLIPYVAGFVPDDAGKKYSPHVSVGVGTIDDLYNTLAEPFDAFTFSPVSASIYQLGDFGTARKKLMDLTAVPERNADRSEPFAGCCPAPADAASLAARASQMCKGRIDDHQKRTAREDRFFRHRRAAAGDLWRKGRIVLLARLLRRQGDRRGRLYLRPADRDELRGDVPVRRRPNSGQFKAPFNQIHNEARVFTYKDTASSRPTATRPIRCCGWTCAPNRW